MGRGVSVTASGTLPNFVIIGALRSGTTSLARQLGSHPDVFMAPEKEIRFFDRHYDRGVDWYRRRFSRAANEHAVGEATPSYMYDASAVSRIARTIPDARLVAVLRNPVDRAYSHYWLNRTRGKENLSFRAALEMEGRRLEEGQVRFGYVDRGRYLPHLLRVCEHFPRKSLLVVLFDELVGQPQELYRRLCRFLGIDDGFVPPNLGRAINRFVTFRSPAVRRATRALPDPLRRVIGRLNVRAATYPPMDPPDRAALSARFKDDDAELASWLGQELPWRT